VKFRFIEEQRVAFPVTKLCEMLSVSPAGFYASRTRPPSVRAVDNAMLETEVRRAFDESHGRYGAPRVHAELVAHGRKVSLNRVARVMRELGLRARRKRRFVPTTNSRHEMPVAANVLDRRFTADAPNKVWVTDITYVWTWEGWLYLAAILDLFSRRVIGWAMSESLSRDLALDALDMALRTRAPPEGLLHHSDRGCQYASADYQAALAERGITCSMSRKGNCWDNAVAESFFATLKTELVNEAIYDTRAQARLSIFEYMEVFYNRRRRHSSLGYVSPLNYELMYATMNEAA
jgi:transposase InsO family protein